jgi:hypothetical protein
VSRSEQALDAVAEYDEMWRWTRETLHRMGGAYRCWRGGVPILPAEAVLRHALFFSVTDRKPRPPMPTTKTVDLAGP